MILARLAIPLLCNVKIGMVSILNSNLLLASFRLYNIVIDLLLTLASYSNVLVIELYTFEGVG